MTRGWVRQWGGISKGFTKVPQRCGQERQDAPAPQEAPAGVAAGERLPADQRGHGIQGHSSAPSWDNGAVAGGLDEPRVPGSLPACQLKRYGGDDWAEDHHDVHLMNEVGGQLAARQLPEGVRGVTALHELLAQHASEPGEVVIAIETDRGPWVSALLAAGYRVYAVNPRSVARYRDRHHVGGAKSDAGDAKLSAA